MMKTFHHAYNGISTVNPKNNVSFEPTSFGYQCLDHIAPTRLSGTITVEIQTKTPTLPGFRTPAGRIAVPSASGNPEGATSIQDALIPATALKGMLSSAYEAVTLSRLRIFDTQHTRTLSHRPSARKAQSTYPAFLTNDGNRWELVFTFRKQPKKPDIQFWSGNNRPLTVGLIDSTAGDDGYSDVLQLRGNLPHLADIRYTSKRTKIQNNTTREIATAIRYYDCKNQQATLGLTGDGEPPRFFQNRGFVVRTRSDDHTTNNSERKCYEFIFPFVEKENEKDAYRIHVDKAIIDQFLSTLHDYAQNTLNEAQRLGYTSQANTDDEQIKAGQIALSNTPRLVHSYLKPQLSQRKSFTQIDITDRSIELYLKKHINDVHNAGAPGIPVFVSIDINNENETWKLGAIKISPVGRMIGKDSVSAYKLAQDQHIDPVHSIEKASPGDSLWGFAPQTDDSEDSSPGGLRGRIEIESAHFVTQDSASYDKRTPLLRIHKPEFRLVLSSPKPRTGVPYLRDSHGNSLERKAPGSDRRTPIPRDRTFIAGQTLARKVYPTHQQLIKKQIDLPEATTNTAMASEIASWIEPDAIFHSRIHFINLSNRELAVLLWLLSPKMLAEKIKGIKEGYHHIGFGKPIGMGSVRIEATSCRILTGNILARQYKELAGIYGLFNRIPLSNGDFKTVREIRIQGHIDKYLSKDFKYFKESAPVKCFRRQACGWNDNIPISYPTLEQEGRQSEDVSDNPTLLWFRMREDNRAKLASLYEDPLAKHEDIEQVESNFGRYSFETLDE